VPTPTALPQASAAASHAQDARFVLPFEELERRITHDEFTIEKAAISRPKVATDITLRSEVKFADGYAMRVKLRRATKGASDFNNEPRYELAAYMLQKMFLTPDEYVVPPTSLRFVPVETLRQYAKAAQPTFYGADYTLCVMQYWLKNVSAPDDAYDRERFERNPLFARHLANLNVLTYLINHKDSNSGNVLTAAIPESKGQPDEADPRVFIVDNGVAFDSEESDKGEIWRELRVKRIPKDTFERVSSIRQEDLQALLGTVAQWEIRDGVPVAVPPGQPSSVHKGVRTPPKTIQLGLTKHEIGGIYRQIVKLRNLVASGDIQTF
jgi:hypothetical protein